ncbi:MULTISPECIES: OvmZ protein [unclassified Streptomyces]|uniref:OvmZ protein n=1 Tax=unclassified Streptomyces TaxID=2593676 RepID=UPI00363EF672
MCHDRLRDQLLGLPGLYDSCEEELTPARPALTERVSSGSPRQGVRLNEAALVARSELLPVLASWAGLIVTQRKVAGPRRRAAGPLAAFLRLHLDWLAAHPAAAEFAAEILRVTNLARSVLRPQPVVRPELGACPMDGCTAQVRAVQRGADRSHTVGCADGHVVPPHQWMLLRSRTA